MVSITYIKLLLCFSAPSHLITSFYLALIQAPWPAGSRGRTPWLWSWEVVLLSQTGTGLRRRGAAEMTNPQDRPASPGRAESNGRPSAHRLALHSQGKNRLCHTNVHIAFIWYSLNWRVNVLLLKKSGDHFLELCPTYCLNDKVMKQYKNSDSFFFFLTSGDLARDQQLRSLSKEISFNVSINFFLFSFFFNPLYSLLNMIMPLLRFCLYHLLLDLFEKTLQLKSSFYELFLLL